MSEARFTVGQAAAASGLTAKALRIYERKGLLPPTERTAAGYRLYTDDDVVTLRFIRQAKALDLSLPEIKTILDLHSGGTRPCQHVLTLLEHHIADVDRTIADLHQLRATLTRTHETAADRPPTTQTSSAP